MTLIVSLALISAKVGLDSSAVSALKTLFADHKMPFYYQGICFCQYLHVVLVFLSRCNNMTCIQLRFGSQKR